MPAKKKASKHIPLKIDKPKAKRQPKEPEPKSGRRLLDKIGDVFAVHSGENAIFHITVAPDIQEVTLTLNGRGVFRGQP